MDVAAIIFAVFTLLLLLGVPISFTLGIASMVALWFGTRVPMENIPQMMFAASDSFTLLAIPFFILAGILMEKSGISGRLVNLANRMCGSSIGGLATVSVVASMFFAAISGSGPATVAALGSILIPAMIAAGYDEGFASAIMATSGGIGVIIPPSIAFIVYAVVANASVSKLFMAGVLPGFVVGAALIVAGYVISRKRGYRGAEVATAAEKWQAAKDAFWGVMTPVIILGGIYGGIFTPTEAAGIAVIYAFIIGVFVHRELKLGDLPRILVDTGVSSAVVMLIVSSAAVFSWLLANQNIPALAAEWFLAISRDPIVILLLINILLLIAGCFLDAISAMMILVPILVPVVTALGVDITHFGIIMTVNLAIGMVTPPVGVNLYVACSIAKISIEKISKAVVPLLAAAIVALMMISYIPWLSLALPAYLGLK
ncbi:TRAP transporter large permease [Anaeroselena agilis]|uniref:TRAP transporter large permease n=1 Tax=Anaeroselena agilis TaxID=3063788 RepID=A0ABU3NUR3_9FIRM|nr:TRAP transporter large permease [Selenomonadales bacterium 4137-cl]